MENVSHRCPAKRGICLKNPNTGKEMIDTLHNAAKQIVCNETVCFGSIMSGQSPMRDPDLPREKNEVLELAREFLIEYYTNMESLNSEEHQKRWQQVQEEINSRGTYDLTLDEITYGAKAAWRKAPRCVARILWNTLHVFDCRHISTTQEMFDALCVHLEWATNGGNIRSTITIFPPRIHGREDFRLYNSMLISYAGYKQSDGTIIGDPANAALTQVCESLGWRGAGTRFDILPLVFSSPAEGPKFYEIPKHLVMEVPLVHPTEPWFAEMGLKWFGLPGVADMRLDVGGLEFTAAPFNGWYTGPEVGSRDLCDPQRYNLTKEIGEKMGLDTSNDDTLWKDRVMVFINVAVLHSYKLKGVTIVDHHSVAESFLKFMDQEQKMRGGCPADWVWIVPPFGSDLVPTYKQDMVNYNLKPSYEYQEKAWKSLAEKLEDTANNTNL